MAGIVHLEITGQTTEKLRGHVGELFGPRAPTAETVSKPLKCGVVNGGPTSDGTSIPVGVGGARIMTVT